MYENPYRPWQVNTRLFYGKDRERLIRDISKDLVIYGESSALIGGQRMGKSTLLLKLKETLSANGGVQCFYVDVQSRAQLGGSNDAFAWLGSHAGVDNVGYQDFGRSLKMKWITDGSYAKVVFLIDEFDAFGAYEWHRHFFDNLRALLTSNQDARECVAVTVAGSRRLENLLLGGAGSPLANILSWHYLYLLDEEDSNRLIDDPTGGALPHAIQQALYEKTGGQPYFIQSLMSKLYGGDPDQLEPKLRRAERDFMSKHEGTFKLWWETHLDENDRAVFVLLLKKGVLSKHDIKAQLPEITVTKALKTLSFTGFIRLVGKDNYEIAGTILKDWVTENY